MRSMASFTDRVEDAFTRKDGTFMAQLYGEMLDCLKVNSIVTNDNLLDRLGVDIFRNINAEFYIPQSAKTKNTNLVALRSATNGNCLYSSFSILLVGDNSVVTILRLMTSIELFLYADYYAKHPCFSNLFETQHNKHFDSISSMVAMSVSFEAIDSARSVFSVAELVRAEAVLNAKDMAWTGFVCLLALSSVTSCSIFSYYPDIYSSAYR
ncbi:uncharacterized protein LOC124443666 [Xenia sp. Carnegie-2017]|uniref:uncharacterized protein LOC124443666 n=1 Tax=Xenia sp. Carnegie-2017 TaxID=2897299 RepID=UPI001F048520|nr:uncharacterized protein LOC124443666 [Xenia sp. Carnegie-2017]